MAKAASAARAPDRVRRRSAAADCDAFGAFLDSLAQDAYRGVHRVRYVESYPPFRTYVEAVSHIVELGPASTVSTFLRLRRLIKVTPVESDERRPYAPRDAVLSLEVLEHLSDLHEETSSVDEIAMFTGSGARTSVHVSGACARIRNRAREGDGHRCRLPARVHGDVLCLEQPSGRRPDGVASVPGGEWLRRIGSRQ